MNEREIERLLKEYGDSVSPHDLSLRAVPAVRRTPLKWPQFAAASIATVAVAGIAIVGLWPRNAVAGSIARIHRALSDAKTMEYTMSMKIPSGWHPYLHAYYENGVWRYNAQMGTNLEHTAVERDGMELVDYKTLDHASLDVAPPSDDASEKWQTALDFAKKSIDSGNTEVQRSVKIHNHAPVDGRPAYEITMEKPSEHYLARILVDKGTDLPIESSVVADDPRPGFADAPQQIRTVFQFNKKIDPQTFSLDPKNRAVIRMQDARDRLQKMWRTPLGSLDGAEVRAATITRDGTLWLATTASGDKPMLPDSLVDNLTYRYIRGGDVCPSAQLSVKAYDGVFGKPIYVTAFAPLAELAAPLATGDGTETLIRQEPVTSDGKGFRQIANSRQSQKSELERVNIRVARAKAMVNAAAKAWQESVQTGRTHLYRTEPPIIVEAQPFTIQFTRRDPSFVNPGRLLENEISRRESVTVVPVHENGNLPSYFPMLGLDRPNISLIQSILREKAKVFESSKQYQLAAETYGQLAKARYDWVKYSAFQPMLDEARCYRLIGQTQKAEELTQQAAVLKASRER